MPRVTSGPVSRRRHKKVLNRAKGFVGGRGRLIRTAIETVERARRFATYHRRLKKRELRRLWTLRINAACRQNGMTYSRFIAGLKKNSVLLDRKALAEIAVSDPGTFSQLVALAKKAA